MCGPGIVWDIFVPSFQFCSEPKTSLKKKSLKKSINKVIKITYNILLSDKHCYILICVLEVLPVLINPYLAIIYLPVNLSLCSLSKIFGLIYMYFSKLCQVSDQGHYSPGLRSLRHSDKVL